MNVFYALGIMPVIKNTAYNMFLLCVKVKSSVYSAKEYLIESVTTALSICLSTIKIYIDYRMQSTVFPKSIV